MILGIIGRGHWGDTYKRTLDAMGIECWQAGRVYWTQLPKVDGLIIASKPKSHCAIAAYALRVNLPAIIEKPMCLDHYDAEMLLKMVGPKSIVFTGHTRLYSPEWRAFKAKCGKPETVFMQAGGEAPLGWLWDWGSHLVAMCLDLGFDPMEAHLVEMPHRVPISVTVNGNLHFVDGPTQPTALEVLITEFCEAIEKGEQNIEGLKLGAKVVETLERMEETVGA